MKTTFKGKKIDGLLAVLPEMEIMFEDEMSNYNFPEKQTLKLKKLMGYMKHRVVKDTTASSDLCISGMDYLLSKGWLNKEEVGAMIVVSSTHDYLLPGTSSIIHGHYGFSEDVLCFDMIQGCTGFMQGLFQGFMLLDYMEDKKVLLFNVEVLSKKTSKKDRNSYPLIGDAASIAVLSNDAKSTDIFYNGKVDGSRYESLIIPAGGSRMACSADTSELKDLDNDGNLRCLENLTMDGTSIFEFVQKDAPPMIQETLEYAGCTNEDIEWYLFHQPNKFLLKKLAEKIDVEYEKVPMNIVENFGNSSGVCIPLNIAFNFGEKFCQNSYKCCLSAFGSGLSWSAFVMDLGNLNFCEKIVSEY